MNKIPTDELFMFVPSWQWLGMIGIIFSQISLYISSNWANGKAYLNICTGGAFALFLLHPGGKIAPPVIEPI